jgi:hypothetical protein
MPLTLGPCRFAYSAGVGGDKSGSLLFIDGETFELSPRLAFAGPLMADSQTIPPATLKAYLVGGPCEIIRWEG